ncbi:Uncharacterised protein [Candidatus Gugararchaeum adminiculabundum]|nr:Uncharacterised protein [Candidatus Gugararchaeum adminiculabundum]
MANDTAIVTRARQTPFAPQLTKHLSAFFRPVLNENGFIHCRPQPETTRIIKLREAMNTLKSTNPSPDEQAKAVQDIFNVIGSLKTEKKSYKSSPKVFAYCKGAPAELKAARNLVVPDVVEMLKKMTSRTDKPEMLMLIPILHLAGDGRGLNVLAKIRADESPGNPNKIGGDVWIAAQNATCEIESLQKQRI